MQLISSWSFSSNRRVQPMTQPQLKGCSGNVPKPVIKEEQPMHIRQESVQAQVTPSPSFEIKEKMTLATLPKVSLKSHKIGTTHCQLQTRINKEKQGPSHRNSCYNIWRYQDTRPHSPQDKQLQENIHFSFYATLYMQSLTTRQATSSNTATS